MNTKTIIESLSMDLLRVALGLHRGSFVMADRFKQEALKREDELSSVQPESKYLLKILNQLRKILQKVTKEQAEDILMYSILLQNFARKYYSS